MNSDTIKAITDAVTPLAAKIGETGAYIYPLYVKEAVLNGWGMFGVGAFLVLVAIGLAVWAVAEYKKQQVATNHYNDGFFCVPLFGGLVVLFFAGVLIFFGLRNIVNPQFRAVEYIVCDVNPDSCR